MRPQDRELAARCILSGVPVIVFGPPGIGKTAIAETWLVPELSRRSGSEWQLIRFAANERLPEDAGGYPKALEDRVVRLPDDWVYEALQARKAGKKILVIIDEANTCSVQMQAPILHIVNERHVGNKYLGDATDVGFLLLCNPPSQAPAANDFAPSSVSRYAHIHTEADAEDWLSWVDEVGSPSLKKIGRFIRLKTEHLFNFPKNPVDDMGRPVPYSTPRTWTLLSKILHENEAPGNVEDLAKGIVGPAAAREFAAYWMTSHLPQPQELLSDQRLYGNTARPIDEATMLLHGVVAYVTERKLSVLYSKAWTLIAYVWTLHRDVGMLVPFTQKLKQLATSVKAPKISTYANEILKDTGLL